MCTSRRAGEQGLVQCLDTIVQRLFVYLLSESRDLTEMTRFGMFIR